jgi:hypothetical protein
MNRPTMLLPRALLTRSSSRARSFATFKRAQGGGEAAAPKAEPAAATEAAPGRQDVHLMSEDEYLQYCQR